MIIDFQGGKKRSDQHAAVWVPDNEANVCMCCKRTQFTMIVRRHHCRNCGAVVCNPCSPKKFLLPSSTKPQRVCLDCFDLLNTMNQQVRHRKQLWNNRQLNRRIEFDDFRALQLIHLKWRQRIPLEVAILQMMMMLKMLTRHTKRWVRQHVNFYIASDIKGEYVSTIFWNNNIIAIYLMPRKNFVTRFIQEGILWNEYDDYIWSIFNKN